MQIRPGSSLLQAIAKSAEPRPVPFAQRLADLAATAPAKAPVATVQTDRAARIPPEATQQAARQSVAGPIKPRGSVIDVIV